MSTALQGDFLSAKSADVRRARAHRKAADADADASLRDRCLRLPASPSLAAALRAGERVAVMAEYKRRSPSAGDLAASETPEEVAAGYVAAGAAALSVLTDAPHFGGALADLEAVARLSPGIPVLRKDFIVDPRQLAEARHAGAAAALLIVAMLDDAELPALIAEARTVGLDCLVEVHTEAELDRAAAAGAGLIGINNRDLRRLTTDLAVTGRLAPRAPAGSVVVSESGIRSPDDVRRVRDAGAHAVLVGEALLRATPAARGAALRALAGVER